MAFECADVGEVTCTGAAPLSRAGLGVQAYEITEELLKIWDKSHDLSRAGLRRQVARMMGKMTPMVGHPGP